MDQDFDELDDLFEQEAGIFEHPYWTRKFWRDEVAQEATILGYWDWAKHRFVSELEDAVFNPADNGNQGS